MELNEMEKKLLFQVEGDYQTKILNELYMTVRYSNNSEQREAAEGLMAKLRVLSNAECMDLVKDIQKNYRLPYPARTIGEKIAEARQQSGAEKLKGHDIMALERFDPEVKHMSSLALGTNQIEIERGLTTSSTAIFVPFTTCELFQEGEALYYGLNALSNNLIMANRKTLKNPNGLFLGTPGSGKSFSAKREIVNVFLLTEDDIIIADPENEYGPLVQQFGSQGQVIDISPTSTNYINPMDINLDYSDDENPITLKSDFILSLCDLIIGGKEGLSPIERTIIDPVSYTHLTLPTT